jgi:hypothetical protein
MHDLPGDSIPEHVRARLWEEAKPRLWKAIHEECPPDVRDEILAAIERNDRIQVAFEKGEMVVDIAGYIFKQPYEYEPDDPSGMN